MSLCCSAARGATTRAVLYFTYVPPKTMGEVAQQTPLLVDFDLNIPQIVVDDYTTASEQVGQTYFLTTTERREIEILPDVQVREIINLVRVNDIPQLNSFFAVVNQKLLPGGLFTGCMQTSAQLKRQILQRYPVWFSWPYYVLFFLINRVLPKIWLTQGLYLFFTGGRYRVISEVEVLGRLVYCGFEIVDFREIGEELYYTVRKARHSISNGTPSYGVVFRMRRIGQGGRPVYIYKLRTMHPYAEYLQAYIHAKNNLQSNGKFKDDFRIATWGRYLRRLWIDELPMVLNWLKGDIKLVGVRPLSEHYLSLYPEEFLKRRLHCKPGLLPPFYADLPEGFDAILASEARYLEAYEKHPYRTDMRYLLCILHKILIQRARSQ